MSEVKDIIQKYYVYECRVDGVLRYVGMGKGTRLWHCTSGKSSCSELNRDFHEGKDVQVVKVKENLTKFDAMNLENQLILSTEGLYNKKKEMDFGSQPDFKRTGKYKILASYYDSKTRPKLLKLLGNKADNMTEELHNNLKELLSECGLEIFMVQYDGASTPILILDRSETLDYEIKHLGCLNYPNCAAARSCGSW